MSGIIYCHVTEHFLTGKYGLIFSEMDVLEGFLLEWWSICFDFDFFREWVQVRPHVSCPVGKAPSTMDLIVAQFKLVYKCKSYVIYIYFCVGHRVDSYPIHNWMECGPNSSGVHTPSNGTWSMSGHSIPHKLSTKKHFSKCNSVYKKYFFFFKKKYL